MSFGIEKQLVKIWRALVAVTYYLLGVNVTEAILFLPTALILFIPSPVLVGLKHLVISACTAVFGTSCFSGSSRYYYPGICGTRLALKKPLFASAGLYSVGGKKYTPSFVGYLDDKQFGAPPALKQQARSFPTESVLSLVNAEVFQACINLSYESWELVKAALSSWNTGKQKIEWIAGYEVDSVAWIDPLKQPGDLERDRKVELAAKAFIVKVNDAVIVTFKGTDPFQLADWMTDWNLFGSESAGRYGRVHPGFRIALGLDANLGPLPNVRTSLKMTNGQDKPGAQDCTSFYSTLLKKIQSVHEGNPRGKVYITGHSLGGALAAVFATAVGLNEKGSASLLNLAAPKINGVFTIGQPRLGDAKFAGQVTAQLKHTDIEPTFIRAVVCNDIVPHMPPTGTQTLEPASYQHSGLLLFISPFGNIFHLSEQPSITFGLVFFVGLVNAIRVTQLYLSQWWTNAANRLAVYPGVLLVLSQWLAFIFFFNHGVSNHIPANYSQVIMTSKPSDFDASTNTPEEPHVGRNMLSEASDVAKGVAQPLRRRFYKHVNFSSWEQVKSGLQKGIHGLSEHGGTHAPKKSS